MDRKEFEKLVKVDIAAIRFEKRECINVYEMRKMNSADDTRAPDALIARVYMRVCIHECIHE